MWGAWSGKTTRDMAEESGILDFYNYVYTPFSQCAHSTWYHVGRYNSDPSESPLTRQLWMPQNRLVLTKRCLELELGRQVLGQVIQHLRRKGLGACRRRPESSDWISNEIEARFTTDTGEGSSSSEGEGQSNPGPNK